MKSRTLDSTRYKQKRGQGELQHYIPWYLIHELSSHGVSWEVWSEKTGRIHHLLSTMEKKVMYYLDDREDISDIREQYPLNLEETKVIAANNNIKHPFDDGMYRTLTTDFLITINDKLLAISVKPEQRLNERVIEKFQIEFQYWKERKIDWVLITEEAINNL